MRRSVVACMAVGAWAASASAQPAEAPAQSDWQRSQALVDAANRERAAGKLGDAIRDFDAAYELTHDPDLLLELGTTYQLAGRCGLALMYYRRYLAENGTLDPGGAKATQERIDACEAQLPGRKPDPAPRAAPEPAAATEPAAAPPPAPAAPAAHGNDAAWLFVGGSLAFLTTAVVLAYSASSSEQDVRDLYSGLNGVPPAFDASTQTRYQQLIDEGHRYEYLSWTSFGLAAGCAATAAILFARGNHAVEPLVTPTSAGVAVRF